MICFFKPWLIFLILNLSDVHGSMYLHPGNWVNSRPPSTVCNVRVSFNIQKLPCNSPTYFYSNIQGCFRINEQDHVSEEPTEFAQRRENILNQNDDLPTRSKSRGSLMPVFDLDQPTHKWILENVRRVCRKCPDEMVNSIIKQILLHLKYQRQRHMKNPRLIDIIKLLKK